MSSQLVGNIIKEHEDRIRKLENTIEELMNKDNTLKAVSEEGVDIKKNSKIDFKKLLRSMKK